MLCCCCCWVVRWLGCMLSGILQLWSWLFLIIVLDVEIVYNKCGGVSIIPWMILGWVGAMICQRVGLCSSTRHDHHWDQWMSSVCSFCQMGSIWECPKQDRGFWCLVLNVVEISSVGILPMKGVESLLVLVNYTWSPMQIMWRSVTLDRNLAGMNGEQKYYSVAWMGWGSGCILQTPPWHSSIWHDHWDQSSRRIGNIS